MHGRDPGERAEDFRLADVAGMDDPIRAFEGAQRLAAHEAVSEMMPIPVTFFKNRVV
jgi:hypothetical protein